MKHVADDMLLYYRTFVILYLLSVLCLEFHCKPAGYDKCTGDDLPRFRDMFIVENTKTMDRTERRPFATLPPGLSIQQSSIPGAGLGVWSERYFPRGTRFGPYTGLKTQSLDKWEYAWNVYTGNFKFKHYIDGYYKNMTSWLLYINCPVTIENENLFLYQLDDNIYYVTYECIKPGQELFIWYGKSYGKELGLKRRKEDYKRRFNENMVRYIIENTLTFTDKVTQLYSKCYKFYDGSPFQKPPGTSGKFDKYCFNDGSYEVCRYRPCKLNPCTNRYDCSDCEGYCRHLGVYRKTGEKFRHADRQNTCVCEEDGHFGCTIFTQSAELICT